MLNEIKQLFEGQPLEATTGQMTDGALYDNHRNEHELAGDYSMLYQDRLPRMMSQQLFDELAELRENTTICSRDPAEEARCRLRHPFFEPGDSLPWPPVYPPDPLKYDFYADRYSDESSSPSLSFASEPSDLGNWNERVTVGDRSPILLHSATHPQCYSSLDFGHESSILQPEAPSPPPKIIPHLIGEDDPFNPFSYNLIFEDKGARSIDTIKGKIFAPVPKLPTAAALANFEVIALTAMLPAVEGVVTKKPFPNKNDTSFFDKISRMMFSSKEAAPPSSFPASTMAPIQQSNAEHGDVLYQTGPKPQVKLMDDMIALLSLEPGPLKDEKMTQLWNLNGQVAAGSSSGKPASEITGNEVYEALVPVPPQPPTSYPTNRQRSPSFASSLRTIDQRVSRNWSQEKSWK